MDYHNNVATRTQHGAPVGPLLTRLVGRKCHGATHVCMHDDKI